MNTLSILSLFLVLPCNIVLATEKSTPLRELKSSTVASETVPLKGQFLFLSKNAFFFEGKVLSKKLFLKAINEGGKTNGKTLLALHCAKGCFSSDFLALHKELSKAGYLVCSDAHPVDINELYKKLAKGNESAAKAKTSEPSYSARAELL